MSQTPREQILASRLKKAACIEQLLQDTERVCKLQTPESRAAVIAAAQKLTCDIGESEFDISFVPEDDWYGGAILRINSRLGFCQVHFKADGTLKMVNTMANSKIRGYFENLDQLKHCLDKTYKPK